ncbi:MAG: STAS domain-containing protein [Albidovulum sp.]|uniref:STAS domain-containing protein n=1 Tax=Albidovulum sp. TaxID=1872424 RepID=UPI003C8D75C3
MRASEQVGGTESLVLDGRLDLPAAAPLFASLTVRCGTPLSLDAGQVSHLGTLCLQILLAAAAEWRKHGQVLTLSPVSAAFSEALSTFGVDLDALQAPGASVQQAEEA